MLVIKIAGPRIAAGEINKMDWDVVLDGRPDQPGILKYRPADPITNNYAARDNDYYR